MMISLTVVCLFRLSDIGYSIGIRVIELCVYRERVLPPTSSQQSSSNNNQTLSSSSSSSSSLSSLSGVGRRETRIVSMLQYIHSSIWKYLFNKVSDGLEKATDKDDECN